MFSRIFLTLFALLFATFMVVSNPLSAVAEEHDGAAAGAAGKRAMTVLQTRSRKLTILLNRMKPRVMKHLSINIFNADY